MSKEQQSETCRFCNLPKSREEVVSLTQWILVCSCNLDNSTEIVEEVEVAVCKICGKRIQAGRKGSFTQWILRSDLCSCEEPELGTMMIGLPNQEAEEQVEERELASSLPDAIELSQEELPLERFVPIAVLGKGISSSVYLCLDKLLNKKVAIKCLYNLSEDIAVRFQREAILYTQLHHENIASVLDFGISPAQTPYMVLEFTEGGSLKKLIDNKTLNNLSDILTIFGQILQGVKYAHSKNILHHDLKPENVVVYKNKEGVWQVKLIDFGFAQIIQEGQAKEEEHLVGTPAYMPPDQPSGYSYDERSEVYSLGCILYELFEGEIPYSGDSSLAILNLHTNGPLPELTDPHELFVDKKPITAIIHKSMAKKQEDRFKTVSEFETALEDFLIETDKKEGGTSYSADKARTKEKKAKSFLLAFLVLLIVLVPSLPWLLSTIEKDEKENLNELKKYSIADVPEKEAVTFKYSQDGQLIPSNFSALRDEDLKNIEEQEIPFLTLMGSQITGKGFKYLANKEINRIKINNSLVEDQYMHYLKKVDGLKILGLSDTAIGNKGLKALNGIDLRTLFLYGSPNIDDTSIDIIVKQFPNLRQLSLASKSITTEGFKKLKGLKKLRKFNVHTEVINDQNFEILTSLPLHQLSMNWMPVTDKGLTLLYSSTSINELKLQGCSKITKAGLQALKRSRPDIRVQRFSETGFVTGITGDYSKIIKEVEKNPFDF